MASYIHDLIYAWSNSIGMLRPAYLKARLAIVARQIKHLISNRLYLAIIGVSLLGSICLLWPVRWDRTNDYSVVVYVIQLGMLDVWFTLVTTAFVGIQEYKNNWRYLGQVLSSIFLFSVCLIVTLICCKPLFMVAPGLIGWLFSSYGFVRVILVLAALSFFDSYAVMSNRGASVGSIFKWFVPAYAYSVGQAAVTAFAQLPLMLVTIFVFKRSNGLLRYALYWMHSIVGFIGVSILLLMFIICFVCWLNTLRSKK